MPRRCFRSKPSWSGLPPPATGTVTACPDLALVLNEVDLGPPMEIRLVVLAGTPGGQYTPLSAASASYCRAQKFFHLEAKTGASLFVTAVDKAEGDALGTATLQFRLQPAARRLLS